MILQDNISLRVHILTDCFISGCLFTGLEITNFHSLKHITLHGKDKLYILFVKKKLNLFLKRVERRDSCFSINIDIFQKHFMTVMVEGT